MSASLYGRRCGSIRTWQRSAMAWTVAPVVSSIRSRAVSWGAAAYGSATMSRAVKVELGHDGGPSTGSGRMAGLLRASTAAKNSSMACRTSLPPSKPRQSNRSRPTSS